MKLFIFPKFDLTHDKGEGGIKRVVEAQHRWLPEYGVELVTKESDADLVAVHADEYRTNKPVVFHNHGLYWSGYDWQGWAYDANAKAVRMAKRAQAMTVPSQWVQYAWQRGMLLNPHVLYHGVELEDWSPDENYGYVLWQKNRPDPICDPEDVNRLARLAPERAFLSTFGDPSLPNMTVTGRVPHERSREFIRHAAVYLATTMETGAITVLEAAAAGVPSVGFRHGANSEVIVDGETGVLVEPGDYEALRDALEYVYAHRDGLGAAGRELVRDRFQWRDRIRDYLPVYEAALSGALAVRTGPKVSIVVTAYNLDRYLPACLDSIKSQDFTDWECIVVDDASPDTCGEIAEQYAREDSRFRVIRNNQNSYLAEARNIGLRASSGEYIVPLDADDEIGPGALGVLVEALEKDRDIDIAAGRFQLINPDQSRWVSTWPPKDPTYERQIARMNQMPYSSLYRRWVWDRTGGYRRRWKTAEDAEFWTRAMSYGAVPANVTDLPSLVYNNRSDSMSHQHPVPDWTAWFPWARHPEFTPFGAEPGSAAVACHPIKISVVIPCGPGHEIYLQDALDSVVAQTFQDWEVIVVNDTGVELDERYLSGYPFARVCSPVDGRNHGVAYARNLGATWARGSYIALLDADDFYQPLALELMYRAIGQYGGWVYTDFYDQEGNLKEVQDFDFDQAIGKMPGPITGLYKKSDWEAVHGFSEDVVYWEDWDFLLKLMENCVCGVHLRYPCFTYRYLTGQRREAAYANQPKALKEIHQRHPTLYAK